MDQPSTLPPEKPSTPPTSSGGINISGGDVRAGRDIIGGDVNITGDSITGQTVTVQRGYSAQEVQRLVMIVGALVFVTATCFFIFGAVSAAAAVNFIGAGLPGGSSQEEAIAMQRKIDLLQALPQGSTFSNVSFTEDEISSYFRFLLGPAIGVNDGRARFTDTTGVVVLGGNLSSAGNLPFLAQVALTTEEQPLKLQGAWLKVLPTPENWSFGWIPVTPLAQDLSQRINRFMFGHVQFTQVQQTGKSEGDLPQNILVSGVAR